MAVMNVLGIDPGLDGALAMWDGSSLITHRIPAIKSTGKGREICWEELNVSWAEKFSLADHAFLERVNVRPGEGVSSAFKFGLVYGGLRGMITSRILPYTLVTPAKWKKYFTLPASKEAAVVKASQLFPSNSAEFRGPRGGILDGVAEAALISYYGFNVLKGQ